MITFDQVQNFDRDGFVLIPDLFSREEIETLLHHTRGERVTAHKNGMNDSEGRASKLALWATIENDVWGAVSAHPRIVNSARALLREDVYHWHSKVMLKEPRVGGAWEWHQDYGYWYGDGCLYPRMISCLIALDDANRQNGCLKVLTGSHLLGRIDHGQTGGQHGSDTQRLRAIEEVLPVHYVEAPAGSALFFHCNLLHASDPNTSERARTSYICCYNTFSNAPYGGKGHGQVEPIQVVPDDAILGFAPMVAAMEKPFHD